MNRKGSWAWLAAICLAVCVFAGCGCPERLPAAAAEDPLLTLTPGEVPVGGIVEVQIRPGEGAQSVTYLLESEGREVFRGKEDTHFTAAFRPRQEGEYLLTAEIRYEDGTVRTETAAARASGVAENPQGPEVIYSQKDGSWKDKAYGKSELDNAGCAIFTLSHALQRMGWTGEEIEPAKMAETYRKCYTKAGTANARLIYYAGQDFGYATANNLIKDRAALREGLKNGDYYSFGIVIGHIALMTGIDEKAEKVRVVDSAPSATFERIKKGKVYILHDGEYTAVSDPSEIPGAKYYFETGYFGGLEYYMDLDYCARRGGRLIRPTWLYFEGENGKIGASMVSLGSGECEIAVNKEKRTVPTRELRWGADGTPRLAFVNRKKAVRVYNAAGKRNGSVPACAVVPVLGEEGDRWMVMLGEKRGYVAKADVEILEPLAGEILHGTISVKGNTSGRAQVKLRFGPSEKEKVMEQWKTGTPVTLLRREGEFWQVEARGLRLWVNGNYLISEETEILPPAEPDPAAAEEAEAKETEKTAEDAAEEPEDGDAAEKPAEDAGTDAAGGGDGAQEAAEGEEA